MLCGPWAALQFPKANADVITFGAPWVSPAPLLLRKLASSFPWVLHLTVAVC
jgi:hypothetical protein